MTTLLIDTSSPIAYIALSQKGVIYSKKEILETKQLSRLLLPAVHTLLQDELHSCSPLTLENIALGIGPGSYTGTRIGASVAISFRFALSIPITTFPSSLLPNLEEIADLCYKKFLQKEWAHQIELVYFSPTF